MEMLFLEDATRHKKRRNLRQKKKLNTWKECKLMRFVTLKTLFAQVRPAREQYFKLIWFNLLLKAEGGTLL